MTTNAPDAIPADLNQTGLIAAYDSATDYLMLVDDRSKQMIRTAIRAYLSADRASPSPLAAPVAEGWRDMASAPGGELREPDAELVQVVIEILVMRAENYRTTAKPLTDDCVFGDHVLTLDERSVPMFPKSKAHAQKRVRALTAHVLNALSKHGGNDA